MKFSKNSKLDLAIMSLRHDYHRQCTQDLSQDTASFGPITTDSLVKTNNLKQMHECRCDYDANRNLFERVCSYMIERVGRCQSTRNCGHFSNCLFTHDSWPMNIKRYIVSKY